ncbi:hypothetical protein V6Z11_A10G268200 [Gossypium hirsutum]
MKEEKEIKGEGKKSQARLTWEPWVRGSRRHEACWT